VAAAWLIFCDARRREHRTEHKTRAATLLKRGG